eukprot:CAMPEP_0204834548 /NCGR_PEP_ID=MMETSP1346-20131115/20045_1 /ASSEMBLY_ACC=CAM_ASM_000771 /TAXON_ID=215587 /ORGANISM="Aplanochytrium stocchinoi, Strain GSBS06" /LENGTH=470 /DNA_ID=CAMNT_0051967917 /DNA_START=106 /DNA_END=1518 /DNA_ORIENTATION=+
MSAVPFAKPEEGKPYLIYQLGTNNWQREGEFAPGSGILHEAHHNAYNDHIPGYVSYSLYPSEKQTPHPDPKIEVFHLEHPIPICESVSPVSNYRWHGMSEEEFSAYKDRLEETVYNQMAAAEKAEGTHISLAIAHHTFLNPLVLRNVLRRRVKEGRPKAALACFVHGTALKMYVHEMKGGNQKEFPKRFLPLLQSEKVFDSFGETGDGVQICYAISNQQVDALENVFPEFPRDRVVVSPNGINQSIFHEIEGSSIDKTLSKFSTWYYEGSKRESKPIDTSDISHMVVIVSKFANWKRIDALLKAAAIYEKKPGMEGTALVIVGSGPHEAQVKYQDLAYDELQLERCYFLGPKPQPILAELYSCADVGVFPSKNEPFGMVFVECMACGTPVIGANSGGPKDFVSDDVGELVPESDSIDTLAKSLADAIERAIKDKWKETRKAACKELVESKYSVTVQCSNLVQATREFLQH